MDFLDALRTYRAVVESGSFAVAARRLKLSRALVSKHVARLEDRIRARLLNRTTRHLSVTENGSKFYESSSRILAEVEQAEREMQNDSAEPRGIIRINAPHAFATAHVAPFMSELLIAYPLLEVDISLNDRFVDPVEEGFDLTIRITDKLPESSLIARRLAPCRIVVCGAPQYFARHGEPRIPDDLRQHSCLGYAFSTRENTWEFECPDGHKHAVPVRGRVFTNSGDMLRAVTLGGSGITLMPTFLIGPELEAGRLVPVLSDYRPLERDIYAIYPSRKFLSAKVKACIEFFAGKYGPEPYWDKWLKLLPTPAGNACEPAHATLPA